MSDHRISNIGLRRLEQEFPEGFDPEHSYGIIPKQPSPEDRMWILDYDPQKRYLKLNGFVVRHFQLESHADIYFTKLFKQNKWIKRVNVNSPAKAGILINNTKLPQALRNAIFDKGDDDKLLIVHTIIDRDRSKNFGIREDEIREFINEKRDQHYSLLKDGKRK
jgi:hypothetical protein